MATKTRAQRKRLRAIRAAAQSGEIIAMAADVSIVAAAEGEKGPPKFSVEAYTGGTLAVKGYNYPVVVDLSGLKFANDIKANLDHDRSKRVGHVTETDNNGKRIFLAGLISAATDAAREVIESDGNKYPWKASIETMPTRKPEFVSPGSQVTVNAQTFTGPLYVARESELYGFAFLDRGADSDTVVKIAAGADDPNPGGKPMDKVLKEWIESEAGKAWLIKAGFAKPEELKEIQLVPLKAGYDAELEAAKKAGSPAPIIAAPKFDIDEIKVEYEIHASKIEAVLFANEDEVPREKFVEIKAKAKSDSFTLKKKAIEKEWSGLQFKAEAIEAAAKVELELIRAGRPKGPQITSSGHDVTGDVIEAAIMQRLNFPDHEKQYSPEVLQSAHTAFRGRIKLQQVLLMAAAQNGFNAGPFNGVNDGNMRDVIAYAFPSPGPQSPIHAAGATAFSLPGIFSNVANKELLMGFNEEDQTWREIAAVKSVSDFKAVTSYRMLDDMEFEELPPDGQMKHGQVSEESYTRQVRTYAKMFSLTRQDIINDDLGAFDDLRTRLGRGSARKFNKVFWTKFIANTSFFTTARGNLITGATTTLLTDYVGLALAITAFDNLESTAVAPNTKGKRIQGAGTRTGGVPTILLTPPELSATADRIHAPIAAATTADVNIYSGKYRPVKAHQLSDSTYTGYSATAWYLLRSPQVLAAVVASFLNGNQSPTVESADAAFDRLGVDFRGYGDFGVDFAEWLCGVRSDGA